MTVSFSAGDMRPWIRSTRKASSGPLVRRSNSSSTLASSVRLALLHARSNHIALPSFTQLAAKELPPLLALIIGAQIRVDILPPRWRLPQRRDVQVTEQRHGHRARNRRRRHDQVMRIRARTLQCRPLPHAELVLLVNHHQSQARELQLLVQQCLSADQQIDFTRLHRFVQLLALRCRE